MAFGSAVVMGFPSQELVKWINSYFITGFLFAQEPASASEINWHLLPGGPTSGQWGADELLSAVHTFQGGSLSSCIIMASLGTFIYSLGYLLRPHPSTAPTEIWCSKRLGEDSHLSYCSA